MTDALAIVDANPNVSAIRTPGNAGGDRTIGNWAIGNGT
jgi:hypothetical protein